MIEIKVTNLDTMPPDAIRKIAGLFEVIADYATIKPAPSQQVPPAAPVQPQAPVEAHSFTAAVSEGTIPTPPAAADAFGKLDIPAILKLDPVEPALPPVHEGAVVQLDAAGFPWDGRIHSSSKAIVADGTWRKKRGVEESVVAQVEAELKQTMGAPAALKVVPVGHTETVPLNVTYNDAFGSEKQETIEVSPETAAALVPPVLAAPEVPLPPPTAASVAPSTPATATGQAVPASDGVAPTASPSEVPGNFPAFMRAVTAKFAAKELTQPQIQQAVQKVGLPSLPMLASRPDLIAAVAAELGVTV